MDPNNITMEVLTPATESHDASAVTSTPHVTKMSGRRHESNRSTCLETSGAAGQELGRTSNGSFRSHGVRFAETQSFQFVQKSTIPGFQSARMGSKQEALKYIAPCLTRLWARSHELSHSGGGGVKRAMKVSLVHILCARMFVFLPSRVNLFRDSWQDHFKWDQESSSCVYLLAEETCMLPFGFHGVAFLDSLQSRHLHATKLRVPPTLAHSDEVQDNQQSMLTQTPAFWDFIGVVSK